MPAPLTPEWVAHVDERLRSAAIPEDLQVAPTIVIEQVIVDVRGGSSAGDAAGEFRYHMELGPDGCRCDLGAAEDATIRYRQSAETATAVAEGRRTAHEAFMLGDLLVEGDSQRLADASAWLEWLGAVLAG